MKATWQVLQKGLFLLLIGGVTVVLVFALGTMARQSLSPSDSVGVAQQDAASPTPKAELTGVPSLSTPTMLATRTPDATIPAATQTPDLAVGLDTASWSVYEDPEYGFRLRYPSNYTYGSKGPSNEILRETIFYNPSTHQPGISTDFDGIGLLILNNPRKFASVKEWADAHLFSTPDSVQYSLQFQTYEIVREFNIGNNQATEIITTSGVGTRERSIIIPLDDKVVYIFHHTDLPQEQSFFQTMASTFEVKTDNAMSASTPTALPTNTPTMTPTPVVIQTPDSTAALDNTNRLIYDDAKYGFRVRYPSHFTYSSNSVPSNEIQHEVSFYDPTQYQPGTSTEFNGIGLLVLDNPDRLTPVEVWADAHLFSTPSSVRYSLQWESYEIIHTFPVQDREATYFTAPSPYGTIVHNIFIPLSDQGRVVLIFFQTNQSVLEPIAQTIASTFEATVAIAPPAPTPTALPTNTPTMTPTPVATHTPNPTLMLDMTN